MSNFGNVG